MVYALTALVVVAPVVAVAVVPGPLLKASVGAPEDFEFLFVSHEEMFLLSAGKVIADPLAVLWLGELLSASQSPK
jgi:hypothetical protein